MSFDIFVIATPLQDGASFDRAVVERAFAKLTDDTLSDYWRLRMADGSETYATLLIDEEPTISGFCVNRPPSFEAFPEFWTALFNVMAETRALLHWPGDGPTPRACVTDPSVIETLPPDFIEGLGTPTVAASGADLDAAIALT